MADYRIYCLDGHGHIGLADWIEAETDDEAMKIARTMRPNAHRCEIWLKNLLVGTLTPDGQFMIPKPTSESSFSRAS